MDRRLIGHIEKRGKNTYRLTVRGGSDYQGEPIRNRKTIFCDKEPAKGKKWPREVELELSKYISEVDSRFVDPNKISFAQFVERWLSEYVDKELAPKTIYRYKEMLDSRILPALGHFKLDQLRPLHLISFYNNLKEDGIRKPRKKKVKGKMADVPVPGGLSERTILHHHRLISSILQNAVDWQVMEHNPAKNAKSPKVHKKELNNFYDDLQVAELLECLKTAPINYQAIVWVAIYSGCRSGEITGLHWRDIDFDNNTIKVVQSSQYLPGQGTFFKDPKNEYSKREINVPQIVMDVLRLHETENKKIIILDKDKTDEENQRVVENTPVFTQWDGKPMHALTPSKWFNKFLERNKLPHITFHGLRHTNISLLVSMGFDPITIGKRTGHNQAATIYNTYAHALKNKDKTAADMLGKLLDKGNPLTKEKS